MNKDAIIIHLLAQRAALRTALERAKRLSIAGNGFAEASQALSDDDRMEEKTAAMLQEMSRQEPSPHEQDAARHITTTGGIN